MKEKVMFTAVHWHAIHSWNIKYTFNFSFNKTLTGFQRLGWKWSRAPNESSASPSVCFHWWDYANRMTAMIRRNPPSAIRLFKIGLRSRLRVWAPSSWSGVLLLKVDSSVKSINIWMHKIHFIKVIKVVYIMVGTKHCGDKVVFVPNYQKQIII